MSTFRPCIRPLVITRGSDQLAVSTKYEDRNDIGVVRNYGSMLVELCSVIPDGIVAFFTSYSYMEQLVSEWDAMGVLRDLTKAKLVFIETKDVVETTLALDNYRRACDSGRGAVFLSVARGKVRGITSISYKFCKLTSYLSLRLLITLFKLGSHFKIRFQKVSISIDTMVVLLLCLAFHFNILCHMCYEHDLNFSKRIIRFEKRIF